MSWFSGWSVVTIIEQSSSGSETLVILNWIGQIALSEGLKLLVNKEAKTINQKYW